MKIRLAYGTDGLDVDVPVPVEVLAARGAPGLPDETAAIRAALRAPMGCAPLRQLVRRGDQTTIVHTDITRATPNDRLLPVLLAELEEAGVRPADITLLNALGTHRRQTEAELRALLGDFVFDHYRCLQHDAWDDAGLVSLGRTSAGHPLRVNRVYAEADVRILTGFIEPHFFAGYSGGPKGILPSIAGFESVATNHSREMVGHPRATWGVTEGNPIWDEMREAALRARPTFLLNVTLNARRKITGVFAGDLLAAHAAGTAFVAEHAQVAVAAPYDVVVTTNSGYPLDQSLYQSIKGLSAAARVVRPGGAILLCAACQDGLPAHGQYAALLAQGGSPRGVLDLLAQPGFSAHDQWQVQIQAQIQLVADCYVYSDGLTDHELRRALLTPVRDVPAALAALRARYGPRTGVLPTGPETIPTLLSGEVLNQQP
jgi:nickel-dependent lactate racemase